MEKLEQLAKQLKSLDVVKLAKEVIEENRELLEDFNALQLEEGLLATGKDITPDYAPITKEIKQAKGQPFDRVTLKDTGDFRESIRIKVTRNELAFEATDPKTDDLKDKYGEEILGLADDDRKEFLESYLREELQNKIRKHLNG